VAKPYLPSAEEIAALQKQIREERERGLITVQIKTARGPRWIVRRQAKKPKPKNVRGRNDDYQPPIYRLKLS
jgi:hypothetical protein